VSLPPKGKDQTKTYDISKREVWEAYRQVKANRGAGGVDGQSLALFDKDLGNNLYKIWNRMASGSYMPPPVLEVTIPKKDGGDRRLGIPTVSDRIAQTVVKNRLEPRLERVFHRDSYGYRPLKSAHDALKVTRKRCWEYDWVIDLDIKGFFDTIDHGLLLKAVEHHVGESWMRQYIKGWIEAPLQEAKSGNLKARNQGTPQGGVISPLLANLFLHYVFDLWMDRNHPDAPFARYADDAVIHCRSQAKAEELLTAITKRFEACGLQLHPIKTKLVYCKDSNRPGSHDHEKFTFLGYDFRPRLARSRYGKYFVSFLPAISQGAVIDLREEIRSWNLKSLCHLEIAEIARMFNAKIQGWINYYGLFYGSELNIKVLRYLNSVLERWAAKKFKRLHGSLRQARRWLYGIFGRESRLWAHWKHGVGMYG